MFGVEQHVKSPHVNTQVTWLGRSSQLDGREAATYWEHTVTWTPSSSIATMIQEFVWPISSSSFMAHHYGPLVTSRIRDGIEAYVDPKRQSRIKRMPNTQLQVEAPRVTRNSRLYKYVYVFQLQATFKLPVHKRKQAYSGINKPSFLFSRSQRLRNKPKQITKPNLSHLHARVYLHLPRRITSNDQNSRHVPDRRGHVHWQRYQIHVPVLHLDKHGPRREDALPPRQGSPAWVGILRKQGHQNHWCARHVPRLQEEVSRMITRDPVVEGPSYLARVTRSPNLGQVITGLGLRDNDLSTGLHGEDRDSRYACALEEVTAVRLSLWWHRLKYLWHTFLAQSK